MIENFYKVSTKKIEVSVKPQFVQRNFIVENKKVFFWRYFVKIKNNSSDTVQIIRRYWKIINENGSIQEVFGDGVVGKKPFLVPQLEFEYDSQVYLNYPSAIMGGYYEVRKDNGELFQIKIPNFSLDIPGAQIILN